MKHCIDELLHQSLEGHRIMAKIHGDSQGSALQRMAGRLEMQKRGVRFLPAQAIKRAARKYKNPKLYENCKPDSGDAV